MKIKKTIFLTTLLLTIPTISFAFNRQFSIPNNQTNYQQQLAQNLSNQELENLAQSVTVRVVGDGSKGSGTIIAQQGNSYLILTNQHVVRLSQNLKIHTADGQTHQAQLVGNFKRENLDLALLKITTNNNYQTAPLATELPSENEPVLSSGFDIQTGKLNLISGKINKVSDKSFKKGYQIGFTGEIEIGMSGGAIFNQRGEIIGINGRKAYPVLNTGFVYEDETKPSDSEIENYRTLNWGIPLTTFLAQINPEIITSYNLPIVKTEVARNEKKSTAFSLENGFPALEYEGWIAEIENKARQFTVKINELNAKNGNFIRNGSGVIIKKEGDTYYVLTAYHVVKKYKPEIDEYQTFPANKYEIVAPDGKVYEIKSTDVKPAEGVDLAVVKFRSKENYQVATLANYSVNSINNDKVTFAAGYPNLDQGKDAPWRFSAGYMFDRNKGLFSQRSSDFKGKTESPPGVIPKISVEVTPPQSLSEGYELVYSSMTAGGMSGGAVLDSEGRVIGIHGRAEGGKEVSTGGTGYDELIGYSLGIPVNTVLGVSKKIGVSPQSVTKDKPSTLSEGEKEVFEENLLKLSFPEESTTAKGWMYRGNQLWRLRRYEEAVSAFDEAIKQKPNFIHLAYYGKGLALAEMEKYREALQALEKVMEFKPDFVASLYLQAKIYSKEELEEYESALEVINQAIELDEDNPSLYREKSFALQSSGKHQEALEVINHIINDLQVINSLLFVNRGWIYHKLGEYDQGINDCSEAILLDENNLFAYGMRAAIYNILGEYDKALADATKAILLDESYTEAYNVRGDSYIGLREYEKAIADRTQAILLDGDDSGNYFSRAIAYYYSQKYEKAIDDFTQAILRDENYGSAYKLRAVAYQTQKQYDKAIDDYTQAIIIDKNDIGAYLGRANVYSTFREEHDKAIADYTKAINIDENSLYRYGNYITLYLQRALNYIIKKEYEKAIADLTIAINSGKNNFADVRFDDKKPFDNKYRQWAINTYLKVLDRYYYFRCDSYFQLGKYQEAIDDCSEVIKINPDYLNAYIYRGYAYNNLGEYQKAIDDYSKAIEMKWNRAELLYRDRGIMYSKLKQYDKAIKDCTKAIEIKPDFVDAYMIRGEAYGNLKEYQKAVDDFTQAIKIDENNVKAYRQRALAYANLEEYNKAINDLNQALILKPNNPVLLTLRGAVFMELEEYQKAIDDYSKAIKINPDNADVYFRRGIAYQKQGNYQQAIKDYNQAIAKNEKFYPALTNIGLINYEMGDKTEALNQWQKALEIEPKFAEVMLAIGVYYFSEGKEKEGLKLAQQALEIDEEWADIEHLRESLWGDKLIADTEKLLNQGEITERLK